MPKTIELPDGYNGHTVTCFAEPIQKPKGSIVLLRVAVPQYRIRWCHRETYEQALKAAKVSQ